MTDTPSLPTYPGTDRPIQPGDLFGLWQLAHEALIRSEGIVTDLRGLQRPSTALHTQRILELRMMRDKCVQAAKNLPYHQSRQAARSNADTLTWALAELGEKDPQP